MDSASIRVAVAQFGVTDDVQANLDTCLRMIDQAARCKPTLIVLPEFVNHMAWYRDAAHCYSVAVERHGSFLRAVGAKAREHQCYIKLNVTLKRPEPEYIGSEREVIGKVTGTNILFEPTGNMIGACDKHILMGNENNFLQRACSIAPVIETPFGKAGMYACMDGVIPEVARSLAVRGAHVLLNSLNSFAFDEAWLHVPVRAAENKVFVAAANKVGPLVPEEIRDMVAERLKIHPDFLEGAGESQIVAPDGSVLARAPRRGEAVVYADIDVREAENKLRPDGTDVFATRRPELYRPIAAPSQEHQTKPGAERILAGVIQISRSGNAAVALVSQWIAEAENRGVRIIVLPELFHLPPEWFHFPDAEWAQQESQAMVTALRSVLNIAYVVTSIVENGTHTGVMFNKDGVVLRQPQLHASGRHAWSKLGDALHVVDTEWGRVAMVVGNDAIYPETFRLAALQGVEVVAVPTMILERWEATLGFRERAAENRMNVLVASRSESGIHAVTADFTLWTEWKHRPFDGNINAPVTTMAQGEGLILAEIYPAAAANKMVSYRTNLLHDRPWRLAGPLVGS